MGGLRSRIVNRNIHFSHYRHTNEKTGTLNVLTALAYVVAVALYLAAPVAGAAPAKPLDDNLAALWTRVLETRKPRTSATPRRSPI